MGTPRRTRTPPRTLRRNPRRATRGDINEGGDASRGHSQDNIITGENNENVAPDQCGKKLLASDLVKELLSSLEQLRIQQQRNIEELAALVEYERQEMEQLRIQMQIEQLRLENEVRLRQEEAARNEQERQHLEQLRIQQQRRSQKIENMAARISERQLMKQLRVQQEIQRRFQEQVGDYAKSRKLLA